MIHNLCLSPNEESLMEKRLHYKNAAASFLRVFGHETRSEISPGPCIRTPYAAEKSVSRACSNIRKRLYFDGHLVLVIVQEDRAGRLSVTALLKKIFFLLTQN